MKLKIELSWPEPELWPNRRDHWSKRAHAAKDARSEAYWATNIALAAAGLMGVPAGKVYLNVTGHKPNARKRDATNLQAALKAALDGIADALAVDDERFRVTTDWGDLAPPRGHVTIEIGETVSAPGQVIVEIGP